MWLEARTAKYICNSKEKGVFLIWVAKSKLANSSKNSRVDNKVKSRSSKFFRGLKESLLLAEIKAKLTVFLSLF